MQKEIYETPEMNIVSFETEDVITTSGYGVEEDEWLDECAFD